MSARNATMERCRAAGMTDAAIGRQFQISRQRVNAVLGPRPPAVPVPFPDLAARPSASQFEARLRQWRSRSDLTQAEAAERLQVPLGTYQKWETGRVPDLSRLVLRLVHMLEA